MGRESWKVSIERNSKMSGAFGREADVNEEDEMQDYEFFVNWSDSLRENIGHDTISDSSNITQDDINLDVSQYAEHMELYRTMLSMMFGRYASMRNQNHQYISKCLEYHLNQVMSYNFKRYKRILRSLFDNQTHLLIRDDNWVNFEREMNKLFRAYDRERTTNSAVTAANSGRVEQGDVVNMRSFSINSEDISDDTDVEQGDVVDMRSFSINSEDISDDIDVEQGDVVDMRSSSIISEDISDDIDNKLSLENNYYYVDIRSSAIPDFLYVQNGAQNENFGLLPPPDNIDRNYVWYQNGRWRGDQKDKMWAYALTFLLRIDAATDERNIKIRWVKENIRVCGSWVVSHGRSYSWRQSPDSSTAEAVREKLIEAIAERRRRYGNIAKRNGGVIDSSIVAGPIQEVLTLNADEMMKVAKKFLAAYNNEIGAIMGYEINWDSNMCCFCVNYTFETIDLRMCFQPKYRDALSVLEAMDALKKWLDEVHLSVVRN